MNTDQGSFTGSQGINLGYGQVIGKVRFLADYIGTSLDNASNLPSKPKAWSVELSSRTTGPWAIYPCVNIVNIKKPGDFGWAINYRSCDAGSTPFGARDWDFYVPGNGDGTYSAVTKGGDNVDGWMFALQYVAAPNVLITGEFHDVWLKDLALTNRTQAHLDNAFELAIQYYY